MRFSSGKSILGTSSSTSDCYSGTFINFCLGEIQQIRNQVGKNNTEMFKQSPLKVVAVSYKRFHIIIVILLENLKVLWKNGCSREVVAKGKGGSTEFAFVRLKEGRAVPPKGNQGRDANFYWQCFSHFICFSFPL